MKKKNKFFLFILIIFILISFVISYHIKNDDSFVFAAREEEKTALEKELAELEALILQYQRDITKTEAEKQSLQHQINTIKRQIDGLDLQIRQSNLAIQRLGLQIQDTEESIIETSLKIEDLGVNLTDILRAINEEDKKSYVEIMLMGNNLSDFFDNVLYLEILNSRNKDILLDIKNLKAQLENQKVVLGGERGDFEKLVRLNISQKQESERAKKSQEDLLKMTEAQYQQYLKEKGDVERRAAEIREKIFQLAGISEVEMPSFGQALEIAQWVQSQTGVRPAFLLSIITQESALARNVGQCYIANETTGASIHITSGQLYNKGIHSTRDLPLFLLITKELGKNPLKTPISCYIPMCYSSTLRRTTYTSMNINGNPNCPVGYVPFGFGGAMGPAQFIPSTWNSYKNELERRLGKKPSPWSVRDSFLAAGLLLESNGAATNELTAAAKYFGAANIGYESSVMQRARCIQTFIDNGTIDFLCEGLIFIPQ